MLPGDKFLTDDVAIRVHYTHTISGYAVFELVNEILNTGWSEDYSGGTNWDLERFEQKFNDLGVDSEVVSAMPFEWDLNDALDWDVRNQIADEIQALADDIGGDTGMLSLENLLCVFAQYGVWEPGEYRVDWY